MSVKLYLQERREQIVNLVNRDGRVSVADLSERFGLSQTTIRADLNALVQQGLVVRTHGGAIPADQAFNFLGDGLRDAADPYVR